MVVRRRPTLPHSLGCSTIGAVGLSFRVRNGTGRFPHAVTAVTLLPVPPGVVGPGVDRTRIRGWEVCGYNIFSGCFLYSVVPPRFYGGGGSCCWLGTA